MVEAGRRWTEEASAARRLRPPHQPRTSTHSRRQPGSRAGGGVWRRLEFDSRYLAILCRSFRHGSRRSRSGTSRAVPPRYGSHSQSCHPSEIACRRNPSVPADKISRIEEIPHSHTSREIVPDLFSLFERRRPAVRCKKVSTQRQHAFNLAEHLRRRFCRARARPRIPRDAPRGSGRSRCDDSAPGSGRQHKCRRTRPRGIGINPPPERNLSHQLYGERWR